MKKTSKSNLKIVIIVIVIIALLLTVILLFSSYVSAILLGFGTRKPLSIEVIRYNWSEDTEENVLVTDNEEILEIYNAIRYADIEKVQFDSEGLETSGDCVIILHFKDEDICLSTQGEGMKDSIYFCKYLNQNSPDDFIEVWLDNSKLMDVLSEYK